MLEIRYLYAVTTFAQRQQPIYVTRMQTLAYLARDDDEAYITAFRYCALRYPRAQGWLHDVSILRISGDSIAAHGTRVPPPELED